MLSSRKLILAAAVLACGGVSAEARAQSQGVAAASFARDRNVSVRERPRPEYDALGVHVGAWTVLPKLTLSEGYEDNIYAQETNTTSDNVSTATGEFQAISNWSRNAVRLFGRLQYENYADQSNNSNLTYALGGSGQLDVDRNTFLTAAASYQHQIESRTAAGTLQSVRSPIEYNQSGLDFTGVHTFNRLKVQGSFNYTHFDFENNRLFDGTFFPQDYRDQDVWREGLRTDYALSPSISAYFDIGLNQQTFNQRLVSTYNRDSQGANFQIGVDFDLTRLARGNFQIGSLSQTYDDARIGDVSGFGLSGRIQYFPTQITTVTFSADRSVASSGLIESPSFVVSNFSVMVDHELRRNVILTGRLGILNGDYQGLDRQDTQFTASFGATYLLNRNVGLSLQFARVSQDSSGRVRGPIFDDNRVSLALTLQR